LAEWGDRVFDLSTFVFFIDEFCGGESTNMLTDRLSSHGHPFPDSPEGQAGFVLEELQDLDSAMVGDPLK
jgi:hypothetical protein